MELHFVDMAGIACCSLLFYLYLFFSKQKDYALRFISMYLFIYFSIAGITTLMCDDISLLQLLVKFLFPLLFVVFYPMCAKHKLSKKEINLLSLISLIGIVSFILYWLIVALFSLFGKRI